MIRSLQSSCGRAPGRARTRPPARFDGMEGLEQRLALSTVFWDGGGDGVSLMNRFNWEGNQVPNSGDHAVIDVAGSISVTLGSGRFQVKSLTLAEELTVVGGQLVASESFNVLGQLNVVGGEIDDPLVTGHAQIDVHGRLKWSAGSFWGNGDITVHPGGTFSIEGEGRMDLRRNVYNHGDVIWISGDIDGVQGPGTSWINESDGFFKIAADGKFRDRGSPDVLINRGLMVRDGAGEARILAWFENHGTLNVVSGLMKIVDGGVNTGQRHVAAGGVLHYYNDYEHAAGSTLTGGGTTIWQAGVHTITGSWTSASFLHVTDALVTGPGMLSTDGPITFNHGRFDLDGGIHINPDGKLALMTSGQHVLANDVVNDGTLIWNNGRMTLEDATITNNADRMFFVRAPHTAEAVGQGRIVNHGEIRKQLPIAMGLGNVRLDNQGLVNVRNGQFTLDPAFVDQVQGHTLAGGRWTVFVVGNLVMPGAAMDTIGAGASVVRWTTNSRFDALDGLTRVQGSIEFIGGSTFEYAAPAGGAFVNDGTITLRRATKLRIAGDYQQAGSGVLDVHIGNGFLLGTGRLLVDGVAHLDGTANITFVNYAPAAGRQFFFLAASGGVTGAFTNLVLPPTSGLSPALVYGPASVRLAFT